MLKKLSNGQLEKLLTHTIGISRVLIEGYLKEGDGDVGSASEMVSGEFFESLTAEYDRQGIPFPEPPAGPFTNEYYDLDRRRKEQDLSRMCGRWMTSGNRCGVEISRRGEHFILTYLKRNGYPSDERYLLTWFDDGDIIYYGHHDRITALALNTRSDTLMISPGMDYTRVPPNEK